MGLGGIFVKPGEIYTEDNPMWPARIVHIKLLKYLGQDMWLVHCKIELDGYIKYRTIKLSGADISEYYKKES